MRPNGSTTRDASIPRVPRAFARLVDQRAPTLVQATACACQRRSEQHRLSRELLKEQAPTAQLGFFSQPKHPSLTDEAFERYIVGVAATAPFDVAHVNAQYVSPLIVERLHGLGMQSHANDAMTTEDVQRALRAGADKFSVNDVGMARSVVE